MPQTHHSFPAGVTGEGKGACSDMVLAPCPWGIEQEMVHQAWQGAAGVGMELLGCAGCRDVVLQHTWLPQAKEGGVGTACSQPLCLKAFTSGRP